MATVSVASKRRRLELPGDDRNVSDDPRIPVTLLSGFLGAGKTSLLRHLLQRRRDRGVEDGGAVAVVVNDMAELNVDGAWVANWVENRDGLVQMQNGCICCTLRVEFVDALLRLVEAKKEPRESSNGETKHVAMTQPVFDSILIESTGISEPQQVAEAFADELSPRIRTLQEEGNPMALAMGKLARAARLDCCVTVIDAANFWDQWASVENVQDNPMGTVSVEPDDTRTLTGLLTQQIEFANVLVINKIDLVSSEEVERLKTFLRTMNHDAEILLSDHSRINIDHILNTGKFDMDKAKASVGWMQDLIQGHVPETVEYGIGSFIYRQRRPFHPKRLFDWLARHFFISSDSIEGYEWASALLEANDLELADSDSHESDHEGSDDGDESLIEGKGSDLGPSPVIPGEDGSSGPAKPNENNPSDEASKEAKASAQEEFQSNWSQAMGASRFLRAKGVLWLANYHTSRLHLSIAGSYCHVEVNGPWFCTFPEDSYHDDPAICAEVGDHQYGDRVTELVFIGQDLRAVDLQRIWEPLLLSDEEFNRGPADWTKQNDPWGMLPADQLLDVVANFQ